MTAERAGGPYCIPCAIVRGGTSKGVYVLDEHLPTNAAERDQVLLALMGSPDPRQIDGLGGANPLTSKVAIISRSGRADSDIEYESVEVGVGETAVCHGIMCGNLLAGVACFALAEGLIVAQYPVTTVRIHCRSTEKQVIAQLALNDGNRIGDDSDTIGAHAVDLRFPHPAGAITGYLLPTGAATTRFTLDAATELEVSIVDAGTLYVFIAASELGRHAGESPDELNRDLVLRSRIEQLRREVANTINRIRFSGAPLIPPHLVKVALVGRGNERASGELGPNLHARIMNSAGVHLAYAVSGGICLVAAATIPGTVVNDLIVATTSPLSLSIGHPSGQLSLSIGWTLHDDEVRIEHAQLSHSARLLMRGSAYVAATRQVPIRVPLADVEFKSAALTP
jgi:2-methylaconitate cis-trans-isomerase PrpF